MLTSVRCFMVQKVCLPVSGQNPKHCWTFEFLRFHIPIFSHTSKDVRQASVSLLGPECFNKTKEKAINMNVKFTDDKAATYCTENIFSCARIVQQYSSRLQCTHFKCRLRLGILINKIVLVSGDAQLQASRVTSNACFPTFIEDKATEMNIV